jgi:very-short-patch-repair endonuclease
VPIGRHIVDFACLSVRLVVEVDGGQHFTQGGIVDDRRRDQWLMSQGFQVLRFSNLDVLTNLDGVLETILAALAAPPPLSPPP